MTNATVSDTPLVDRVDLRGHTLDLHVASRNLPDIAFNLDHFIRINDAMVVNAVVPAGPISRRKDRGCRFTWCA